ncbi:MAG: hypothetical protein JXQ77_00780 [Campylobacterales bacterium]|nr:hypothetical protein [Campylobacterales bacterium]
MIKTYARLALLVLVFSSSLFASPIIKDELLKPKAKEKIIVMADELKEKTGISGYLIATNDALPRGTSMVDYAKKFEVNLNKPYIIFIFAPHNQRIGIIPSSPELSNLYNEADVKDAAIDVVRDEYDGNSIEDKYNVAVVQAFSELADQVAKAKGVQLTTTIPNETQWIVNFLRVFIYAGAIAVFWIFIGRPILRRMKSEQ